MMNVVCFLGGSGSCSFFMAKKTLLEIAFSTWLWCQQSPKIFWQLCGFCLDWDICMCLGLCSADVSPSEPLFHRTLMSFKPPLFHARLPACSYLVWSSWALDIPKHNIALTTAWVACHVDKIICEVGHPLIFQ